MKKKRIFTIITIIIFALLIIPIPAFYRDGGTKAFTAVLYRVVVWNEHREDGTAGRTGAEVHFIPRNFRNIDEFR